MNSKKKYSWKKIFGYVATMILGAGALASIGYGAYQISQTTKISSDFSDGRTFQLNLRLFRTESDGSVKHTNGTPIRIYESESVEKKNIEDSARFLTNTLEQKGLTNVEVSYGYSNIENKQKFNNKPLFENNLEPIVTLYAKFENLSSAFALNDTENEVNDLYNKMKVNNDLSKSYNYEIDVVEPSYNGINYKIESKFNDTGRQGSAKAGLFAASNNADSLTSGRSMDIYDIDLMKDNKINVFVNKNGEVSSSEISYTLKSDLQFKYFNSWDFGQDNYDYQEIYRKTQGETTTYDSTDAPNEAQSYQTNYTWFLWKDKQGCIDYLNSLIGLWYYNIYANDVSPYAFSSTNKDEILASLFPTENNPIYIRNGTDIETRNKINTVIDGLNTNEKAFIAWAVKYSGTGSDSLNWTPSFITEDDLIPVLYLFYNDSIFSPSYVDKNNIASDNTDGASSSVKRGWSFLESTNSSLKDFIGSYYIGTIDYRNFNIYFEDPNDPKEATEDDENPIPDPYATNSFILNALDYSSNAKDFANQLNNSNYKFPILNSNIASLYDNWRGEILNIFKTLNNLYGYIGKDVIINDRWEISEYSPPSDNEDGTSRSTIPTNEVISVTKESFREWKQNFANYYFNGNNIFFNQYITPASILKSFTTLNPLYVLLIIIGGIIFLIGIFVSVRYRIPGFISFLCSALVFVLGVVIYNALGYVFSLYSVLALAIGSFLSFVTPTFLFRNVKKEVSEGSTLGAAILKSTKKYWKMSLDTHVMGILASLAFLFFGKTSNINFGSLLVVSVFLSFIFSGIIYYILLLFYVYVVQFDKVTWYSSNKLFNNFKDFKAENAKKYWLFNKVNFFAKYNYISIITFIIIALIGIILLLTIGPFFSTDFSSSNVIIINNFNQFGWTRNEVINLLKVNTVDSYVYDNQLVIYTLNKISLDNVIAILSNELTSLNPSNLSDLLVELQTNTLVTILTSEALIKIINNALICSAIAIGFCAIWSLLSLNIVSIIPIAITQVLTIFILVGSTSLVAIPIDITVVPIYMFIFIFVTVFSSSVLSSIKSSWDRSLQIKKNDLKLLINNIVSKINANYLFIILVLLTFAILSMIFVSLSLIFTFLTLVVCLLWLFIFNNVIVVQTWYLFVVLRDKFSKELVKSKNQTHHVEYDEQNEQKIIGINC